MGPSSKDVFDHIICDPCLRVYTGGYSPLKGNRDDWHINRSFFLGKLVQFSKSEPK